jgi:hypothetical protein
MLNKVTGRAMAAHHGSRFEAPLVGGVGGVDQRQQVGFRQKGRAVCGDGRAGFRVGLVGSAGGEPRARLDGDRDALG